jgi:aminopeptidase YwaD
MRIALLISLISFQLVAQTERVKNFTQQLCSPEFHGRGYVNGGDSIAANYIAKTFQEIGLQPLNGTYFQSFSFPVNTFPNQMELKIGDKQLVPGVDFIVNEASGKGTNTTNFQTLGVTELYTGKYSFSKLDKNKVFFFRNIGYGGDTLAKVKESLVKIAKYTPVIEVTDKKFTWSVSSTAYNFPFIHVQESAFKTCFVSNSTSISYAIDAKVKSHTARNVFGYLPATKKSKKTILITAHYDHLGRMGAATYFPGANDNASGNAMLISLAEKFKAKGLKNYNLLFVAFAGEEIGLLGSSYMTTHPPLDLKNIQFLLNLDIMGSGEEGITVVNATLFPEEFSRLETINKEKNFLSQIKKRGPAANSDHYFFTEAGVPAFYIYTMGPNKHYHDIYDTYQELSFSAFGNLSNLLEVFFREMK